MKIEPIGYINCEIVANTIYDQTVYYMAMGGNPAMWTTDRLKRTTTFAVWSPHCTESTIQSVIDFDPRRPEQSVRQFYKLLMLQ